MPDNKNINTPEYWDNRYSQGSTYPAVSMGDGPRKFLLSRMLKEGCTVLDIGCGYGDMLGYFVNAGITTKVYGCDITPTGIEKAKKMIPFGEFWVMPTTPAELPYKDMDFVIVSHVAEHLENPELYFKEWLKSVKEKTGKMIILIPLEDDPYIEHLKVWNLQDMDDFAKKISNNYNIMTHYQGWNYDSDGRKAREAIITIMRE